MVKGETHIKFWPEGTVEVTIMETKA